MGDYSRITNGRYTFCPAGSTVTVVVATRVYAHVSVAVTVTVYVPASGKV